MRHGNRKQNLNRKKRVRVINSDIGILLLSQLIDILIYFVYIFTFAKILKKR